MGLRIFLLIASFCLAQVKSQSTYPSVRVLVKDYLDIEKKMDGFAEAATISHVKCLWEIKSSKSTFQRCYARRKGEHKQAVVTFSVRALDAGEALYKNAASYYKERAKNIRHHINTLGNFLKDYQKEFSEKVSQNDFVGINHFIKEYEIKIKEEFIKIHADLQGIHDTTSHGPDLVTLGTCERELEKEIKDMKEESNGIITKIKDCMKIF